MHAVQFYSASRRLHETIMSTSKKHDIEDARRNLSALLERVSRGRTVVTTEPGKPFAAIVSAGAASSQKRGVSLLALRGSGKRLYAAGVGSYFRICLSRRNTFI